MLKSLLRNHKGKFERKNSKRTISDSGGLGLLQMVSEPDMKRCVSEDVRPRRGWIVRSHVDWRRERVPMRTLDPKGGGLWDPTSSGEENETFFIKVWKPLPSKRVLKTLRGSLKRKALAGLQRGWIVRSNVSWRGE